MIARPPTQPSRAAIKAAKVAASSPHALVNLVRLVKALEGGEDDEVEVISSVSRKRAEDMEYAEALLDELSMASEQSSSSSKTLADLRRSLNEIRHVRSVSQTKITHLPQVVVAKDVQVEQSNGHDVEIQQKHSDSTSLPSPPTTTARKRRKAPTIDEYLRQRAREDLASDESGLLPLKSTPTGQSESSRDKLLGGAGGALGSAQLHEELGGQLADMSHRLKLNALHFARSLEDEKDLLEIGQDVLEKNLAGTRSSKKDLSTVSSKSRGTTCMTLGIVLLVLVLFIWTYMLIRFT